MFLVSACNPQESVNEMFSDCSRQDSIISYQDSIIIQLNDSLVQSKLTLDNEEALKWRLNLIESKDSLRRIQIRDDGYSKHIIEEEGFFTDAKYDGVNFAGSLSSDAKLAIYHDISCVITFYSKTGTVVDEEGFVIYDYLKPGNNLFYNHHTYLPKGMSSYTISVKSVSTEY